MVGGVPVLEKGRHSLAVGEAGCPLVVGEEGLPPLVAVVEARHPVVAEGRHRAVGVGADPGGVGEGERTAPRGLLGAEVEERPAEEALPVTFWQPYLVSEKGPYSQ